jgi:hypothetical protein
MKTTIKILLAFTFFVYCGCSPSQKIISDEIVSEEVVSDELIFEEIKEVIVEKPVIVEVPGGEVQAKIDYDELREQLQHLQNQPVIIKQDPEATARLSAYLDQLGNVVTVCEALERQQEVLVPTKETIIKQVREVTKEAVREIVVEEERRFWDKVAGYVKTSLIILLVLIALRFLFPLISPLFK